MKKITLTMWLARDRDGFKTTQLFKNAPKEISSMMYGPLFKGNLYATFEETLGLRPGQCRKVKVTIEEVE